MRAWVMCVCVCVDLDSAPEAERSEVVELLRTVLAVEQADDLGEPLATRQQPQRAAATGDYLQMHTRWRIFKPWTRCRITVSILGRDGVLK